MEMICTLVIAIGAVPAYVCKAQCIKAAVKMNDNRQDFNLFSQRLL